MDATMKTLEALRAKRDAALYLGQLAPLMLEVLKEIKGVDRLNVPEWNAVMRKVDALVRAAEAA